MDIFEKRIDLDFSLEELSRAVAGRYSLDEVVANEVIAVGYEDFNYILKTTKGSFVVKVFSNSRSDELCKTLVEKQLVPYEQGFACPKIYKRDDEALSVINLHNKKFRLCLMDYVDGKDFYRLNELPGKSDMKFIAQQTALLNKLDYKPPLIYDTWAIINFKEEYAKNIKLVDGEYKDKIAKVYDEFCDIDQTKLNYGYVHGDIIETNVMRAKVGGGGYTL